MKHAILTASTILLEHRPGKFSGSGALCYKVCLPAILPKDAIDIILQAIQGRSHYARDDFTGVGGFPDIGLCC